MPSPSTRAPVTPRPQACPYEEYVANQQRVMVSCRANVDKALADGPRLWRQMMIGFTCAGFVGLIMLVLGTVFIAEAVGKQQPITVMLCVMGIVFGIIILVGTLILGKLLISRKWVRCQGERTAIPSVIYSPSLDQLGTSESMVEPPPGYESVVSVVLHPVPLPAGAGNSERSTEYPDQMSLMVMPPKYEEVTKPLPGYMEVYPVTK